MSEFSSSNFVVKDVKFEEFPSPIVYYGSEANIRELYSCCSKYIKKHISSENNLALLRTKVKIYIKTEIILNKNESKLSDKFKLFDNFSGMIKQYIPISFIKQQKVQQICTTCKSFIISTTQICDCGELVDPVYELSVSEKYNYNNLLVKPMTEDRINFENHFNQAQSTEVLKPLIEKNLQEFYNKLDIHFKKNLHPTRKKYIKMKDNDEKKEYISKSEVLSLMKEWGFSKLYNHITLVMKTYFYWDILNLEPYRKKIIEDYEDTQAFYIICPYRGKSSINAEARLYLHLASRNINVDKNDYKFSSDIEILTKYQIIWNWISDRMKIKDPTWKGADIL